MKNILLIIHKLTNGGAEKAIINLANVLKDTYNVTMVVFDNSIKEYIPDVAVIDLKLPANSSFIKKSFAFFDRIKKVKKIKKELNIDCSISYLTGPNLVNCLSRNDDKVIISIRNMQSKLKQSFLKKISNQISLIKSDKIVTVSKMVEEDIKKNYIVEKNKIITIYNMVDNKFIDKQKEEIVEEEVFKNNVVELQEEEIKIITIGRVILQKGQWHLIKAFKLITEKYKNAKLFILGRGDLKEELQALIQKLELQNNVFLLDFKTNPYKYLANSDLFVLTSLYEGMPNVILEAMACNLPIIATDCLGGTKEILSPESSVNSFITEVEYAEYGILIPKLSEQYDISEKLTDEEKKLAKTIVDLISNKEKLNLYVQKSKDRVKDFENTIIKKQWISIIE